MQVHIHAHTGHECVYPRPDEWPLPERFTISVYRGKGEESRTWYADIQGTSPNGTPLDNMTFGETPAHAVLMAADLVRMLFDECSVESHGDVRDVIDIGPRVGPIHGKHCYCRDVTSGGAFPQPFAGTDMPRAAKQCCRCGQVTSLDEFKEGP